MVAPESKKSAKQYIASNALLTALWLVTLGPLSAFVVMLAAGIAHQYWPETIPAFGFWETYILLFAVNIIGSGIKTGIRIKPVSS